jgi:hypothetical protein
MNANELADYLDNNVEAMLFTEQPYIDQAATMLRQFDLAESIIKQQQLEIESLKDEVAKWKMSYENNIRFEAGYGHN